MQIILNADDFGWSDDTVRSTIDCFKHGGLTSATIMANMPATLDAVRYAAAHPEFSFGVHLTFSGGSGERPLSSPSDVPALVEPDGGFLTGRKASTLALQRRLPVDQIEREMAAQIGFVRDHGVPISHVDGHGHIHKFAAMFEALKRVAPRFGITKVRRGQDTWLKKPLHSPLFWLGGAWLHPRIDGPFRTTRHFFMPIADSDRAAMPGMLPRLRGASIEVGVHPGETEPWRRAEHDAAIAFADAARAAWHALVSWNDL